MRRRLVVCHYLAQLVTHLAKKTTENICSVSSEMEFPVIEHKEKQGVKPASDGAIAATINVAVTSRDVPAPLLHTLSTNQ